MDRRALCPKRRNDGKTEAVRKNSRIQNNSARNQRKNDFNMRRRGITNLADVTEDQGEMAETYIQGKVLGVNGAGKVHLCTNIKSNS